MYYVIWLAAGRAVNTHWNLIGSWVDDVKLQGKQTVCDLLPVSLDWGMSRNSPLLPQCSPLAHICQFYINIFTWWLLYSWRFYRMSVSKKLMTLQWLLWTTCIFHCCSWNTHVNFISDGWSDCRSLLNVTNFTSWNQRWQFMKVLFRRTLYCFVLCFGRFPSSSCTKEVSFVGSLHHIFLLYIAVFINIIYVFEFAVFGLYKLYFIICITL